jgi:hypothetical protein
MTLPLSVKPKCLILWFAIALSFLTSRGITYAQTNPRVLVDLSHEFSFRYDIFGFGGTQQYWVEQFSLDKTSTFASLRLDLLDIHDVLVMSQAWTNVPLRKRT